MSMFGELILETSRAFPDDEEEFGGVGLYSQNQYRVTFETTPGSGEQFLKELKPTSDISLYIFNGKVANGFGDGYLKDDQFQIIGDVYLVGMEGTVDTLLTRTERRPIVRLHQGPEKIIFARVDTYGLPRSLANEVVQAISVFVAASKHVVIFHSESLVAYRGEEDVQGKLFHLRSSTTHPEFSSIFKTVRPLPQPNIISGVSAAVLTECEATEKTCVLLMTYCETEFIDSISMKPFFNVLEKGNTGILNIKQEFSKLTFNTSRSFKSNLSHLADSNLIASQSVPGLGAIIMSKPPGSSLPPKKPRQIRTELDRLLMDEGTVNMLCDPSSAANGQNHNTKKAKLEALNLKRLQVISTVRNRSGDSVKKLREKKKPEAKISRRRSEESSLSNGSSQKGPPGLWFKGRRASLLATLKEDRVGGEDGNGKKVEFIGVQKRILTTVTQDGLGHVTITFQPNGRCTIDLKTLRDLTNTLETLGSDPVVNVILISSSGSKFCNGIDLRELIGGSDKKKIAEEIAEAINKYLATLSSLPKLTIISLHSSVSNLFVTSLPLFDLVYASDKSTFRCNYLNLNQVPEGGPLLCESLGRTAFNNLVLSGRVLTASEAKESGLVTEVLWPARFQEEVVIRVRNFLKSKSSSLPATKSMLPRLACLSDRNLEEGKKNLVDSWMSEDFQLAAKRFVNSREVPF